MASTGITHWLSDTKVYDSLLSIYAVLPWVIAPTLFFIDAPYGRFAGKFIVDWSIPGKWGWCLMEIVSPLMFGATVATRPWSTFHASQILCTSMWFIHYFNRTFIHPFRAHSMAPLHLITFACGVVTNVLNGYTNGAWHAQHTVAVSARMVTGVCLWATGMAINVYHDGILFGLRKKKRPGQRYFVPYGGLFRWVSCPNYFGEVVEWLGFAVAAWPSPPAILFAVYTAANLLPRAWRTHAWYQQQFPDYPKRKAALPFLF